MRSPGYATAHPAGMDQGNASMLAAGRTVWNREDYDACWREFDRVAAALGVPLVEDCTAEEAI